MSKADTKVLKLVCWSAVLVFSFLTAVFGYGMHRLFAEAARPGSMGLWCGNIVTDPLGFMLSFGVPVGVSAVVPLGVLWRRGMASGWSLLTAALLALTCTT